MSPSKTVAGGLGAQDVRVEWDSVVLHLRQSKTDQTGKGVQVVLYALPGSDVCPVRAVTECFCACPAGGGWAFLVHRDGVCLSRFQFVSVFRRCLDAAGFVGKHFASHSFRIGAATEAARCRLDEAVVRKIGQWESRRFRSYVRPQLLLE